MIAINDIAAIGGLVFGVSGLVLSIVNYLNDRAKISVTLQWDMAVYPSGENLGVITVTNQGRRPAFVSHVALRMPKTAPNAFIILKSSLEGQLLEEGSRPLVFTVEYNDLLRDQKDYWKHIVAQVSDSTGKTWTSKKFKGEKPSWAD